MSSNVKIGLGLAAGIVAIAVVAYIYASYSGSSLVSSKPGLSPSTDGLPQTEGLSRERETNSRNTGNADASSTNKANGVGTAPNSAAAETTLSKAQRQEQKALRAKAVDELSRALSKGVKADPKEVAAAFDRVEQSMPTPEGKQQIILSRKVYEHGLKIHTLTNELSAIATSTQPQDKARQQVLIAEITNLQTQIQNAANSTREYAAAQRKTLQ
jgi:hypothetical protein